MQYIECCLLYAKIVIVNFRQQLLEFRFIIITFITSIGVIVLAFCYYYYCYFSHQTLAYGVCSKRPKRSSSSSSHLCGWPMISFRHNNLGSSNLCSWTYVVVVVVVDGKDCDCDLHYHCPHYHQCYMMTIMKIDRNAYFMLLFPGDIGSVVVGVLVVCSGPFVVADVYYYEYCGSYFCSMSEYPFIQVLLFFIIGGYSLIMAMFRNPLKNVQGMFIEYLQGLFLVVHWPLWSRPMYDIHLALLIRYFLNGAWS